LIRALAEAHFSMVALHTAEGWSRDVTMDIADELRRLCGTR
jgi:hypothetical protein